MQAAERRAELRLDQALRRAQRLVHRSDDEVLEHLRSSGSIAFGSILISRISPPPVAVTVTIPPPAVACTVSSFSSSCACCICCCICWTCSSILLKSMLTALPPDPTRPDVGIASDASLVAHLARVEGAFHQLDDLLFARRFLLRRFRLAAVFAHFEGQREMAARDLVERLGEQRRVLRILGELTMERSRARELDREGVACEVLGVRLAEHRRGGDRLLLDRGEDRPLPGLLELFQLERRRRRRRRLVGRTCLFGTWPRDCPCPWDMAGMDTALQ